MSNLLLLGKLRIIVLHVHLLVLSSHIGRFCRGSLSSIEQWYLEVTSKLQCYQYTIYIELCIVDMPYHCQHSAFRALVVLHDRGLVPAVLFRSDPLRSDRIYAYPRKAVESGSIGEFSSSDAPPLFRLLLWPGLPDSQSTDRLQTKGISVILESLVHVASACSCYSQISFINFFFVPRSINSTP